MLARILTPGLAVVLALAPLLPVACRPADDAPKGIGGDWKPVSFVLDGKGVALPKGVALAIKGNELTYTVADKNHTHAIKVDDSKTPNTIDITSDVNKDETALGIYEVKGDELRICFAGPGKDRPTELASKEGSGWNLATYKRVKK